jgi:hypothetical protein
VVATRRTLLKMRAARTTRSTIGRNTGRRAATIVMKIRMAVLRMLIIVDGLIKRIWIKGQIGE